MRDPNYVRPVRSKDLLTGQETPVSSPVRKSVVPPPAQQIHDSDSEAAEFEEEDEVNKKTAVNSSAVMELGDSIVWFILSLSLRL